MLLHHHLPGGLRLRLPHRTDADGLRALGSAPEHWLRFDPRERAVIVAAAWAGGVETVVGVGAIALHPGAEPEVVAGDDVVREHLRAALTARATAPVRRARDHGMRRGRSVARSAS